MRRRHFLIRTAAAAPLATTGLRLMAASPGTPRLLVVFLRGAYDAANLLVPFASSYYYEQRPTISIARPGAAADAALPLDADWALAPAVGGSLAPFFDRKELAFVPFAGTDDASRSHFETQDGIELGQPLGGPRDFRSGFMNRLATVLGTRDAIAFTDRLPLTFRGDAAVPNIALRTPSRMPADERQSRLIAAMYQGTPLAGPVADGFAVRDEAARDIGMSASAAMSGAAAEMLAASRNAITAKGFEGEARRIARLVRERYQLGFVDVGGWDTHVGQGAATGLLANRLAELGKGLAAYADELGPAWRDSTVVVISEFGRTMRENGGRGTDHGHGTVYWVLGGGVRGGRIAGEQVKVAAETLFQNRDMPVLNEYRGVLGGVFQRLYGLSAMQAERVFPGAVPKDIGLV